MLRIAIYGSECTGKTTLTHHLADKYNTIWVPEFSRAYAEQKPLLDITDVVPIMHGQIAAEEAAVAKAKAAGKRLVLCDTVPLSSLVYSQYYNHAEPEGAEALARRHYDLYLLTDAGTPWVQDDIRGKDIDRPAMHALFCLALESRNLPYTLLHGSFAERTRMAEQCIDVLLLDYTFPA